MKKKKCFRGRFKNSNNFKFHLGDCVYKIFGVESKD